MPNGTPFCSIFIEIREFRRFCCCSDRKKNDIINIDATIVERGKI